MQHCWGCCGLVFLVDVFTIPNDQIGFSLFFQTLQSAALNLSKVKVELEATGHRNNILGLLLDKGLAAYAINPLHTNLFRKSISLRRTKQTVSMRALLQL